jgi:hypothetical protein
MRVHIHSPTESMERLASKVSMGSNSLPFPVDAAHLIQAANASLMQHIEGFTSYVISKLNIRNSIVFI